MADFSRHAGVEARAWERDMLEWLYRYISRSAVLEKRLSLTPTGDIRYVVEKMDRSGLTGCIPAVCNAK
ncbi:MAG: transposase [Candidatus Thiodiazotropha sp. (ex Cardiolucina cf. quadrata)]|nr:transposase [Candidatus Thiodiazotropha sp. (ex Cardiolucina cf. quadrata)]